ncbi:hypothetical protein ACFVDI_25290 [Nocardioides sp. NPDC057767]|uniref:hypothetical protein n=1 Tax=unclassified Nocardioides TaxID=2615069 RepID=UPI00366F2B7A
MPAPEADTEPAPLPLEQVRRTPGASMAPQLNMAAPSGEQPAFGGGMAPPPAGSEGGGLFGLAARTPKFEPELASQSQSLFLPKRRKVAEEAESAPEEPAAEAPAPERPVTEAPAPQQMPEQLPERQAPEQLPERQAPEQPQSFEPLAPLPERQAPERQLPERQAPERAVSEPLAPLPERAAPERPVAEPLAPLPERPAAAHSQSTEHPAFVDSAPQMGGPTSEMTHEAMPPIEPRQPAPPHPEETSRQAQDNVQAAMSPRFEGVEEATGGTRPREEFEQFAPPQDQFDVSAPEARYDDQADQGQQLPAYGDPAYAPLAPQLEPDQAQWSHPHDQPYGQPQDQPYGQPQDQPYGQSYDQSYDQAFEQPYGQPQDPSQDQFGQSYGDPYGQNIYADATLVGQPPVGPGPNTPAPPPMASQGYDPYGNAFDARYEPQRGQGGEGKGGLDLKRWGLIVLAVAVVVAIIAFVIGLINSNDDANAKTGTTTGATTTAGGAAAEAKKIDELIKTSAKDKAAIGAAQADLEACENIEEAIQTFEDAAASRKELATKVAAIDTAVLPGSRKLVKNLESAWMTAQNADLAFAAWGEKRKINADGECVGGKGKLEKATTLSLASHDPKKAAAKAWGPIAEEYGLEPVEWKKL